VQQHRISPGSRLDQPCHRLAVGLHPQHAIEQQEELVTPLALLDRWSAWLEPTKPRLASITAIESWRSNADSTHHDSVPSLPLQGVQAEGFAAAGSAGTPQLVVSR
jgi:hypothetical protein